MRAITGMYDSSPSALTVPGSFVLVPILPVRLCFRYGLGPNRGELDVEFVLVTS